MSAPAITTIRPGVQFTPNAAASFRRAEHGWGRRIDVNSTYRNWDLQMSWYRAWNAYVAGEGPYPGHSRAIHPNLSAHCKGLGLDSDDWTRPGFNKLMAEHGWIRTAAGDPTERHHFEYQWWRDKHRNQPAGNTIIPIILEETELPDMTETKYYHSAANPKTGLTEYGIFGHQVPGGSRLSTNKSTAVVWGKLYGQADGGSWDLLAWDVWLRLQAEAKVLNAEWVAQQRAISGTTVTIDTAPIMAELAALRDGIEAVNKNIDDQPTHFEITPK